MKVRWTIGGLGVIIAALAVGLVLKSCQRSPDPANKIPPSLAKTLDSLDVTKPTFEGRRDSVLRVVTIDTAAAARAQRLAKASRDSAEGFRKRADSLAALASVYADSTFIWRQAYEARTEEAEQLRRSIDSTESALQSERNARASILTSWRESEARRAELERANAGLRTAIAQLEKPCRILGPIPCPSRTVSAVGGVVIGVVALSSSRR